MEGIIIRKHKKRYTVDSCGDSYVCSVRGRLYKEVKDTKNVTVVGDKVTFSVTGENEGIITEIRERKSKLSRSSIENPHYEQVVVANVDQLLAISSTKKPYFNTDYIDRFIAAGEKGGLDIVVCINKIDLKKNGEIERYAEVYRKIGYTVVLTSAVSGLGLDALKEAMKDKISVLSGQSGVGKSTIINTIQPGMNLRVKEVNPKTGEGTHTTTSVSLFRLDFGAYVVDTPGIREFNLWDIKKSDLNYYFREFDEFAPGCKYRDCVHITEPHCEVSGAVKAGKISEERYNSYVNIYNTLNK